VPALTDPVLRPGALSGLEQPVIAGDELLLRPWRPEDVSVVVAAYSDPDIRQWHGRTLTEQEAVVWIAARHEAWLREIGGDWAVLAGTEIVGRAALKRIDLADGRAEVGYWVLPASRRRGVASRAVRAVGDWALEELGLHRLELMHSTRNEMSCRVAGRAGYALEGVKRLDALHPDGWHDMHLHARVAGD
jgi:RimJ/RimL family protein N-acetyltransferase